MPCGQRLLSGIWLKNHTHHLKLKLKKKAVFLIVWYRAPPHTGIDARCEDLRECSMSSRCPRRTNKANEFISMVEFRMGSYSTFLVGTDEEERAESPNAWQPTQRGHLIEWWQSGREISVTILKGDSPTTHKKNLRSWGDLHQDEMRYQIW